MTSDSVREIEAIDFQASLRPVHGCEWWWRRKARARAGRGKSESRSPAARPAWKLINCDFRLRFDRVPRNFLQRSRPDRRAREEEEEGGMIGGGRNGGMGREPTAIGNWPDDID